MRHMTALEIDSLNPELDRTAADLGGIRRGEQAGLFSYFAAILIALGLIGAWSFLAAM